MSIGFFKEIEKIKLKDDLSLFLGSSINGIVEFSYEDIVKSAGHSCPTVAGAYLSTEAALKYLYKDSIAKRGEILVSFKDDSSDNVIGVITNVITQITGATNNNGFKGINGKFVRHSLISYNENINSSIRFTRSDTNDYVDVNYNPNEILPHQNMQALMQKILKGNGSSEDNKLFASYWQERVEKIFQNKNKVLSLEGK